MDGGTSKENETQREVDNDEPITRDKKKKTLMKEEREKQTKRKFRRKMRSGTLCKKEKCWNIKKYEKRGGGQEENWLETIKQSSDGEKEKEWTISAKKLYRQMNPK